MLPAQVKVEAGVPDWVEQGNVPSDDVFDESLLDSVPDSEETQQDMILPPQKNVTAQIKEVTYKEQAKGAIKKAHVTFVLTDGVKYKGKEDAFKNKHIFQDILTWFDQTIYPKDSGMYKYAMERGLVPYKSLRKATGSSNLGAEIKGLVITADLAKGGNKKTDPKTNEPILDANGKQVYENFNYLTNFKVVESGIKGL